MITTYSLSSPLKASVCAGRVKLAICTVWGRRRGIEDAAGAIPALSVHQGYVINQVLVW